MIQAKDFGLIEIDSDYWVEIEKQLTVKGFHCSIFGRSKESTIFQWNDIIFSVTDNGGEVNVSVHNIGMDSIPYINNKELRDPLAVAMEIMSCIKNIGSVL